MQAHVKNYLKATGKLPYEIDCEKCGSQDIMDIHHVEHRQKNNSELDKAKNLIALCRKCHTWVHANNTQENKQMLRDLIANR